MNKSSLKNIITFSLLIIFSLVIWFTESSLLTNGRKITLILFIMAALFWITEVIPLYVTSLTILAVELIWLTPVLNVEGIKVSGKLFMSPFFSNVILLFLGGLLLSVAGHKYRIDKWIASLVLKVVGAKPRNVLLGIMFTSAWLSMWMSNTATTAVMLIIALALAKQLPVEEKKFQKAFLIGVPFSCNIGGMATPVGSPPNAIALGYLDKMGVQVDFLQWMLIAFPLTILLIFILWMVLLRFYPAPLTKFDISRKEKMSHGYESKLTLIIFVVAVILWLTGKYHGLKSGTVALIVTILLLATRILDSKDFRSISWDILFLVGGGMALGIAVEKSGLSTIIVQQLHLGTLSSTTLFIGFISVGAILTTFMSNTATVNILIPLTVSLPIGAELKPLMVALALAVSLSMTLPVSTPPNAIAYSSGEIDFKDMAKTGAVISVISILSLTTFVFVVWKLIGFY